MFFENRGIKECRFVLITNLGFFRHSFLALGYASGKSRVTNNNKKFMFLLQFFDNLSLRANLQKSRGK